MPDNSQVPPTSPIGYKNPPKHSQFKPGKSGNPRGRPKGKVSAGQMLAKLLATKMKVNVGGQEKTITCLEALLLSLTKSGLNGRLSAIKLLLQLTLDYEAGKKLIPNELEVDPDDMALIEEYFQNKSQSPQKSAEHAKSTIANSTIKIIKASTK